MPTPRAFRAVSLAPKLKRRGRPPKKKVRSNAASSRCAQVSQATRQRLITEAIQSHERSEDATQAYEGMEPTAVASFVNQKIDAYIANYPWWYGGLSTDRPKRERTEAQRMAFEKVRQRKAQIQQEVDAPYVPAGLDQGAEA